MRNKIRMRFDKKKTNEKHTHTNSAYIKIKKEEKKAIEKSHWKLKLLLGVSVWNCIATTDELTKKNLIYA